MKRRVAALFRRINAVHRADEHSRAGGLGPSHQGRPSVFRTDCTRRFGFSLVELVVVIMILGVIAAIAAPRIFSHVKQSRVEGVIRDLQMAYDTMQRYRAEKGTWPADKVHSQFPPELVGYFDPSFFTERNAAGGYYDWNYGYGATAAVSIWTQPSDFELYYEIDKRLDDGNLSTGFVRLKGYNLNYILEP